MASISWDETQPSSDTTASLVDNDIRSMLTAIGTGLGESVYWPGSAASQGGSASSSGELMPGSARLARAGTSARTGGHPDGFLLLDSNKVSLHHIGSSTTGMMGHSNMLDRGAGLEAPFTARWVIQEGTYNSSDRTTEQAFPLEYDGVPFVDISGGQLGTKWMWAPSEVTQGGFTSIGSWVGSGATSAATWYWMSEGTISY
jgi:hypothetical protein